MFEYCRRVLGLRENEAYLRITVARAARENPALLDMLRDGRLHLSGIARLAPHVTRQNSETVLGRASGMSHREIRELVCELEPRPDVASSVRRLPQRPATGGGTPRQLGAPRVESDGVNLETQVATPARPVVVEPLRHIPAAVRRAVHERDGGRCAGPTTLSWRNGTTARTSWRGSERRQAVPACRWTPRSVLTPRALRVSTLTPNRTV
jgi:hypothetical protein